MASIHVVLAELVGDAHGILDGVGIGSAVTNDCDSLDAQQRRTTVFGIVQPPLELLKCILGKNRADLGSEGLFAVPGGAFR